MIVKVMICEGSHRATLCVSLTRKGDIPSFIRSFCVESNRVEWIRSDPIRPEHTRILRLCIPSRSDLRVEWEQQLDTAPSHCFFDPDRPQGSPEGWGCRDAQVRCDSSERTESVI